MKFIWLFLFLSYSIIGIAQQFPAKTVLFTPTAFYNLFSLNNPPALRIRAGDTISTETIDAGGFDQHGVRRQKGGNPLTGPFFIENAEPGDQIAVTLTKVSLNRNTAFTTEYFVSRSMPKDISDQIKQGRRVNWTLNRTEGFATPDSSYKNLHQFRVPLNPFVGCIGVAPDNRKNEILSFFQGVHGGNLDYNRIREGSTIWLPVLHAGAFLYIGDAHALQGDGEIAGNALETSMDVSFTVRLIKAAQTPLPFPRVEDAGFIMAFGIDKDLDNAVKLAGNNLLCWLQAEYQLTLGEANQVMSTIVEYSIAEIADPEVEVVAKIKKSLLAGLIKTAEPSSNMSH